MTHFDLHSSGGEFAARPLQLSEILSALTFALDLTEGAHPGHSLRCCLLGMRIGAAAGLNPRELACLYYALQLKDAGCSSNASRLSALLGGGDEQAVKNVTKITDWTRVKRPDLRYLSVLWRQCRPGATIFTRAKHLIHLASGPENNTKELFALRCERGADIANHLQLGGLVADAVRNLDEHWDGSGYPQGRRGDEVPILSRICLLAQHLDAHAVSESPRAAVRSLASQHKRWYDPTLIATVQHLHKAGRLWENCLPTDSVDNTRRAVLALDPGLVTELTEHRVDSICEAFASIVDAKSPFTHRHSIGVTQIATAIAAELGLAAATQTTIRRAALLHDIGKLAVSNAILDKTGALTATEWEGVRRHPEISGTILRRVPGFGQVAEIAEQHHERLDGTGYPYHRKAADLSLESRVIALADCYSAMAEDRPYRDGMGKARVLQLLARDTPHMLDANCFAALETAAHRWPGSFPQQEDSPSMESQSELNTSWTWPSLAQAM